MNHVINKPLFGKQELIQESRNQTKNLKIPESYQRKFRVADPTTATHTTHNTHTCDDFGASTSKCLSFSHFSCTLRSISRILSSFAYYKHNDDTYVEHKIYDKNSHRWRGSSNWHFSTWTDQRYNAKYSESTLVHPHEEHTCLKFY